MSKYIKKPIAVEAYPWYSNGDHPDDKSEILEHEESKVSYLSEGKVVRRFRRPGTPDAKRCDKCGMIMGTHGWIETLEGGHIVCPGDWIITGVQNENYPIKPDIFAKTYGPAGDIFQNT